MIEKSLPQRGSPVRWNSRVRHPTLIEWSCLATRATANEHRLTEHRLGIKVKCLEAIGLENL